MAPPAVASLSSLQRQEVEYLFHHVFLPPKLPQTADDPDSRPSLESQLVTSVLLSLKAFREHLLITEKRSLDHAVNGIITVTDILGASDGAISETQLAKDLKKVSDGQLGILPLYVGAQNAAVIIAKTTEGMVFEAFELSANNHAVVETKGRLRRTFPGFAVSVEHETSKKPQFQAVVAQALAKMSTQTVPSMQPKTFKAGSFHDEDRDTTHPGVITELFLGGFLKGFGSHAKVDRIAKNTRDEVFWKDTLTPWRRSPMWTFLRVFLHLAFKRSVPEKKGTTTYKAFMVFFMARVLQTALHVSVPSETLYSMSAKIYRRLHKLSVDVPTPLRNAIGQTLHESGDEIAARWAEIQSRCGKRLGLTRLARLDFIGDSQIALPKLIEYIGSVPFRKGDSRAGEIELSSGRAKLHPRVLPHETYFNCEDQLRLAYLQEFEKWVSTPTQLSRCLDSYDADEACSRVYNLLQAYHLAASGAYVGNPEALSTMLSTVAELGQILSDGMAT